MPRALIDKLVSGGQSGVDRATLDWALERGLPCGGWCPRGRMAEDGPLAPRYPLDETPSADYAQRTEWNVRDSDGTLVLTAGAPTGGSAFTVELARRYGRPLQVVDLQAADDACAALRDWLRAERVRVLNVAGPRESKLPGIYGRARVFLDQALGGGGGSSPPGVGP